MTKAEARKALEEFRKELREMPHNTLAVDIEEKVKNLPKAVKVLMFFDEMCRIRKMPEQKRKMEVDHIISELNRRQAKRN